jgi:hypothetical protein
VWSKELLGTVRSHSMESDAGSANRDWALVFIIQRKSRSANTHGRGYSHSIVPASHRSPSIPEKALVLTAHGAQHGRLAANKSSIMMAPGKSLVEAYDFIPDITTSRSCSSCSEVKVLTYRSTETGRLRRMGRRRRKRLLVWPLGVSRCVRGGICHANPRHTGRYQVALEGRRCHRPSR